MRKRRWAAGGLVAALLVGAGVAYGEWGSAPRSAQQRDDYAAGRAAYLRADCAAALPKLRAAQGDGLDDWVTALARADAAACEKYDHGQPAGYGWPPVAAIPGYLAYLKGDPPGPLANDARQQARAALGADIDTGQPSTNLCRHRRYLTDPKVVELTPTDELMARWLAACGTAAADDAEDRENARRTLLELQARFPDSKEAKAAVADLVRISTAAAAEYVDAKPITGFTPVGRDDTLQGRAQLMFYSGSSSPVDLTIAGLPPQYAHLPACEACEGAPDGTVCRPRPSWKKTLITVSAGRHAFQLWSPASDRRKYWDTVGYGTPRFEPNAVYTYCVWD